MNWFVGHEQPGATPCLLLGGGGRGGGLREDGDAAGARASREVRGVGVDGG